MAERSPEGAASTTVGSGSDPALCLGTFACEAGDFVSFQFVFSGVALRELLKTQSVTPKNITVTAPGRLSCTRA